MERCPERDVQTLMVPTICKTWNTMVRENTTSNGTIAESRVASTFLELLLEAEMSSLEESSMISRIAISAPPTPTLMAVVMDTALLAAVEVAALTSINDIMGQCHEISGIKELFVRFHF
jgi:hypothetical protein